MQRVLLCTFALVLRSAVAQAAEDDPRGIDFFEKKIRPVLVANCYKCHSASAKEIGGELRLDTRDGLRKGGESGAAVVPGNVDQSLLLQAIKHEEGMEMPPKQKLGDEIIADFEKWVMLGAPDPRKPNASTVGSKINILAARQWWSFQPPKVVAPQPTKNSTWVRSEIDKYILSALESSNLEPVADADRATLVRRAYFDLIGLPPTPEEVDAFVNDRDPKAYEKLLDRLLAMPQFGERRGRHWLDVARYGESSSKERNIPYPNAWKYRDWVYDAVAADKPYNQFVREQIAGDLLPAKNDAERNAMLTATGLLAIGPKSLNTRNAEQFRMDVADEQLDVVTRSTMALSVACARCHDHKFDPIPTADYYAIAGIFRSTDVLSGVKAGNNMTGYAGKYVQLVSASAKKVELSQEDKAELENLQAQLAEAREKLQRARQAAKASDTPESSPAEAKKGKGKKKAAAVGVEDKQPAPRNVQQLVKRQQQRVQQLLAQIADIQDKTTAGGDVVMGVREGTPEDCRINIRGEVTDLGDTVPRGFVRVLTYPQSPDVNREQSGRLQLAMWLTSERNPLTARVMANRTWFHLFGRGLVATVDNFGALGEQPSHPELLDYLAVKFVDNGWSMKKLIREIMLSRTYQLSGDHHEANYATDPDNKLVWRMSRRRLEAEAIRDSLLAVSGEIDLVRPAGSLTQTITGGEIGRQAKTAGLNQPVKYRSVYLPIVRGLVPDFLNLFDVADAELVVGQRDVTTVAPQALYMMNSPFVAQRAQATAKRLLAKSDLADDSARVDYAFRLVLGHSADSDQRAEALSYLQDCQAGDTSGAQRQAAWANLCQTLFASGEFRYVY